MRFDAGPTRQDHHTRLTRAGPGQQVEKRAPSTRPAPATHTAPQSSPPPHAEPARPCGHTASSCVGELCPASSEATDRSTPWSSSALM